jgi:hypothetical protein
VPYPELGNDRFAARSAGPEPKYGIVGGIELDLLPAAARVTRSNCQDVLLGDLSRAGSHFLVGNNGYRGLNRRAMGVG